MAQSTQQQLAENDTILATVFRDAVPQLADAVETRRRLEDRLEQRRLRREMLEFDYDFAD